MKPFVYRTIIFLGVVIILALYDIKIRQLENRISALYELNAVNVEYQHKVDTYNKKVLEYNEKLQPGLAQRLMK